MKFTKATKRKQIRREWHKFDVSGKILGRISTEIAKKLIGKQKPYYVPNLDCGDHVVVINAAKIKVTGSKAKEKMYGRYSGYPGGLKLKPFDRVLAENPVRIVREAVAGMLPKNKLRKSILKRLYIYPDGKNPYNNKFK